MADMNHEKRASGGGAGMHPTHGGMRMASGGKELNTEGPMPGHEMDKKGGRARHRKGGGVDGDGSDKPQEYNAQGSNEMDEAKDETPGFKKGGKKRKDGGVAEGALEADRMDRRPRRAAGGRAGGSPYSSASAFEAPNNSTSPAARGYEGVSIKGVS